MSVRRPLCMNHAKWASSPRILSCQEISQESYQLAGRLTRRSHSQAPAPSLTVQSCSTLRQARSSCTAHRVKCISSHRRIADTRHGRKVGGRSIPFPPASRDAPSAWAFLRVSAILLSHGSKSQAGETLFPPLCAFFFFSLSLLSRFQLSGAVR